MSVEQNIAVVRQFFAAFDAGDLEGCAAVFSPNAVVYMSGAPGPLNSEGFKQFGATFLTAFPGGYHAIEDMIAVNDKVVTRAVYQGVNTGDLMGIPPTGKQVAVTTMVIDRLADGEIVESWRLFDQLGMMQQLGLAPMPEQGGR